MNKILGFFLLCCLISPALLAQNNEGGVVEGDDWIGDFTYERLSIRERKPVPYPTLREADVMFAWRVHRIMDTKEKQNLVAKWPKNPLHKIIFEAGVKEKLPAYTSDSLTRTMSGEQIEGSVNQEITIQIPHPDFEDEFIDTTIFEVFESEKITRFQIMEDWIFDKQRGIYFPRIIAIAPLRILEKEGINLGEFPIFWLSWNSLRGVLVNEEVFNRHNDGARFSYYDWFELRLFDSYIIKESNVFDDRFSNYEELKDNPLGLLLESERVEEKLFNWESDLWQY